jgi:hypothetical protein
MARVIGTATLAVTCLVLLLPGTAAAAPLRWPAPALTQPTTINVTAANAALRLDVTRDYVVKLPRDAPLEATGGLSITGGRNVVLVGGEIAIPDQGPAPGANDQRALYLKGQTGTVHVEGLLLSGPDLNEGINLDQRLGATVQIQNVRVEGAAPRAVDGGAVHHTDIVQTWAGPAQLRIDRLTASTGYQGFFLQPAQYGRTPTQPWQISHVNLTGLPGSGYLLWKGAGWPIETSHVWLQPVLSRSLALTVRGPLAEWGAGLHLGTYRGGDFVTRNAVGLRYRSPDWRWRNR